MSRFATLRLVENEAAVRHTLDTRAAIADTLSLLKDAETGQRGFVLTGDPAFLAPYTRAGRELSGQLALVQSAMKGDPVQLQNAQKMRELAQEKLAELEQTIALMHAGQADAAQKVVREGRGQRLMEQLRDVARSMEHRRVGRQSRLSICIGSAAYEPRRPSDMDLEVLMAHADANMYQAKKLVSTSRRAARAES